MLHRPRTPFVLALVLGLAALGLHSLQRNALQGHLADASRNEVAKDAARAAATIDEEVRRLSEFAHSLKVSGGPFLELPHGLDGLWIVSSIGSSPPFTELGQVGTPVGVPLSANGSAAGMWRSSSGQALLVSALPLDAERTLIIGRLLEETATRALARTANRTCKLWDLASEVPLPSEADRALPLLSHSSHLVRTDEQGFLVAYRAYGDLAGRPQVLLEARSPHALGHLPAPFMAASLAACIGLALLCWVACVFWRVGRTGQEPPPKDDTNTREMGGVIHNMGNVLNSVNISAAIVSRKVQDLSIQDLGGISTALELHKDDLAGFVSNDDRGQHLQPLLSALSDQLIGEQERLTDEMQSLSDGIEHICDLLRSQQGRAPIEDRSESIQIATLLEKALAITDHSLGTDCQLEVVREFIPDASVETDKHSLLEILVNLIQNARQAMASQDSRPRVLTLRTESSGTTRIRIEVQDSGSGIAPDAMGRVFELGFTTKIEGHGYGLHTAALAARELGGALWASSQGEACGATFTLELPTHPSEAQIAGKGDAL